MISRGELKARPLITLVGGVVYHNYLSEAKPARVVLLRSLVAVGCTDVSVEVMRFLLAEHEKRFGAPVPDAVVLQEGAL